MAPVIQKLKSNFNVKVISTGQHRSMLDQTLEVFNLTPDVDFYLMKPNQTVPNILSESIKTLSTFFMENTPDLVLAQGDTTTALAAALASYYNNIPFGHVEAGLRSFDYQNPWPEEMNRVLISKLSTYHFCPTESSKENLINEGITDNVFVTGNTVIDSLLTFVKKEKQNKKQILVTLHRRENFGKPIDKILSAILDIVKNNKDVNVVFPVHLNPNVREKVYSRLNHERIKLLEPLDYKNFVKIMAESYIILTDSGGIQEEAPALGIPVLVLRETTERPEAVDYGVVKLIGSESKIIIEETTRLLNNEEEYQKMAKGISPYGDGKASERILDILSKNIFSS